MPVREAAASVLALNGYDGAAMRAFADLLVLVVRLDLEAEFATVDLEQFGAYRHLLAFRRGAEVLDVHLEADGGVPFGEMRLYGLDAGALHQTDHIGSGQYAVAPHVPDHQLVIDCRDDLRFEPWCQRHECLSRVIWSRGIPWLRPKTCRRRPARCRRP